MLWKVTAGDWAAAGRAGDSHMTEWAFAHLLYNRASSEPGPFEALFEEAERRCCELGWAFPRIHNHQEALLAIALEIGSARLVRRIVPLIQARRPISLATRSLLQRAESFLDQNP